MAIEPRNHEGVALFLPNLEGGGAERVMVQLANSLSHRGLAVDMLLAQAIGPRLAELAESVRVRELGGRGVAAALPDLVLYLRRVRPAAVLSTLDHANVVAAWSGFLARSGTRVVIRQAMDPTGMPPEDRVSRCIARLMGVSYRLAQHVVVLAEDMRETMITMNGLDREGVTVIPNPVATERIREWASLKANHPWVDDPSTQTTPLVVAAGRLRPQKDFPTLLRAVAKAARQTPLRLAILGEGPDRAGLEALAAELGIRELTLLPGFKTNPYPWLARADVFVLSSLAEGMPNVLLEAMALGRPIVSTDCRTGPRELLDGGRLGKLVPVADSDAMASAILEVLAGDHPPESVLRNEITAFGIDTITDRYLDVLLPCRSDGGE